MEAKWMNFFCECGGLASFIAVFGTGRWIYTGFRRTWAASPRCGSFFDEKPVRESAMTIGPKPMIVME
jgi:hypothetical protein